MIATYIFVTILCGAFSYPFCPYNTDDSEFKFDLKRTSEERNGRDMDFDKFDYKTDMSTEDLLDTDNVKRSTEYTNWRNMFGPQTYFTSLYSPDISMVDNPAGQNADDYLIHLSANKDLIKFLEWTMAHLRSRNSNNSSDNYYPGMNMWKKLNLSGRREVPLYVEEPKYIVMRSEPDDLEPQLRVTPDIPFIPPRGRKYIPNLESLLTRNDLFFPNRGKRDRLNDIFKYDDLFFPHRGRKRTGNNRYPMDDRKKLYWPFVSEGVFTDFDNLPSMLSTSPTVPSARVKNINGLVSTSALHLPPLLQITAPALATDDDEHQDTVECTIAAGTVAQCQKPDDVKTNGFDQSVKAPIHQRQEEKRQRQIKAGAVLTHADSQRDRRLLSSLSTSVEATASSFLPLIQSDQVRRLQQHPIRNKQWRDYYI